MREIVFGALMVSAVGGGVYFFPSARVAYDYPLTVEQAVAQLTAADHNPRRGPFANNVVIVSSPKPNVVQYSTEGFGGYTPLCEAEFTAVEGGVKIATACAGGDEGIAAAKARNEIRYAAFNELVDSALEGRKFDSEKMKLTNVGAAMRNLPAMQKQAYDMARKMEAMSAEDRARRDAIDAAGGEDIASDWAGSGAAAE